MIQIQDLKKIYKQDKQLATEIAEVLGHTASLKEATAAPKKPIEAKKAPAKKKPAAKAPAKNAPKNAKNAAPAPKKAAPAKKQEPPKNGKNNKKKTASVETVAKDTMNDRMLILLRSADISQRLTGLKKILEAITGTLISQAKQAEKYDLVDEVEKIRDRIILHLNSLKSVAKQE